MTSDPSTWRIVHIVDIGTSELFVHRHAVEIPRIIDASQIFEPQRAKSKSAIARVLTDGLMPAFLHLRTIRENAVDEPLELEKRQVYSDFFRVLWHGYKDLVPKAALEMGFNIGFIFQPDKGFEKGLAEFLGSNPKIAQTFGDYLRWQRSHWQGCLHHVRNDYLEHRKMEWQDIKAVYRVGVAETLFANAWNVAAEIFVVLIASKFPPVFGLVEIPERERDPNCPDKFRYVVYAQFPPDAVI
jgi:hypothetical protein